MTTDTQELTLTMTADEAQIMINALAAQPYGQVAPLIHRLMAQAQQQMPQNGAAGLDPEAEQEAVQ